VTVVQLGEVVEAARLHGEGEAILPAIVGDGQEAFFDVDVGGPVLAHGAQLDEMRVWRVIAEGKEEIQRAHKVVGLRERRVLEVDHGKGCASLLREMDQGVRLDLLNQFGDGASIAKVHLSPPDRPAGQSVPEADPFRHRADRGQALRTAFAVPAPPHQAVDADDIMPGLGEVKGGRPAQVPIHPQHDDALLSQTGAMLAPKDERTVRAV
jgi:hypothetical protein